MGLVTSRLVSCICRLLGLVLGIVVAIVTGVLGELGVELGRLGVKVGEWGLTFLVDLLLEQRSRSLHVQGHGQISLCDMKVITAKNIVNFEENQ